jgi:hypothetical protein
MDVSALFGLLVLLVAGAAGGSPRTALVIGNSYSTSTSLSAVSPTSVDDALEVKGALEKFGFDVTFGTGKAKQIIGCSAYDVDERDGAVADLKRGAMNELLDEFTEKTLAAESLNGGAGDGLALFYFSGLGVHSARDARNYLLPDTFGATPLYSADDVYEVTEALWSLARRWTGWRTHCTARPRRGRHAVLHMHRTAVRHCIS